MLVDCPRFWKELFTQLTVGSLCNCLFVIIVISHFGFEGKILVLIAPVPGLCSPFT